jgi:hypothetical protein
MGPKIKVKVKAWFRLGRSAVAGTHMPKLRQMRHSDWQVQLGHHQALGSSSTTATLTLTFLKLIAVLSNHQIFQPRLLRLATRPNPS